MTTNYLRTEQILGMLIAKSSRPLKTVLTTFALIALSVNFACARIGETVAEVTISYGEAYDVITTKTNTWHRYRFNGFYINLDFGKDGKVVEIEYIRNWNLPEFKWKASSEVTQMSDSEIQNFLRANGGERTWTHPEGDQGWFQADGLRAYYGYQENDRSPKNWHYSLIVMTEQQYQYIQQRIKGVENAARSVF
jgi:hypothetical protein